MMKRWATVAIVCAIAGGLVMGGTASAFAASSTVEVKRLSPADVEARREVLLHQMLARPSDLDVAFEYAQLSAKVGDYEAAISTLERMLIYAPNTPRLQLELGVLYYRIGANDVARNHFRGSLTQNAGPSIVGITGNATGSFVNNGAAKAVGVIGNWNVGSNAYKATGIFGGSGTPQGPGN